MLYREALYNKENGDKQGSNETLESTKESIVDIVTPLKLIYNLGKGASNYQELQVRTSLQTSNKVADFHSINMA